MGHPVSVRLDEDTQAMLEEAAKERGIGLSTYLRELATDEARRVRRERIRAQSRAVGTYVAASPEGRAFYAEWGTPTPVGEGSPPRSTGSPQPLRKSPIRNSRKSGG